MRKERIDDRMSDEDLMENVKVAVEYIENGDPMKDVIDDVEVEQALMLLVRLWEDGK